MTQGSCKGAPSLPYFSVSKRSKKSVQPATVSQARLFWVRKSAIQAFLVRALCVTSSGATTKSMPDLNTISAASGSTKILNSAAGVMLPTSKYAPPISTICAIRSAISGACCKAVPILVSGPRGQSVIDLAGAWRRVSTMKSTACCDCSGICGSGKTAPSKPLSPCTCSAVTNPWTIGLSHPAYTGKSARPANSQTCRAL